MTPRLHRASKRRDSRAGFTLIEVMVAMMLMAIGMFSIIQMQYVSIRGHGFARERTEATMIAQCVAEELRTRSVEWVAIPPSISVTFGTVFGAPNPLLLAPLPPMSTDLSFNDLHSLRMYNGQQIATGDNVADAWPINLAGFSPTPPGDDPDNLAVGAIYRVHYIAHQVPLDPMLPTPSGMVRVTIFVSWDNKSHGDQLHDWSAWASEATAFWRRHMVTVTVFLARTRR